MARQTSFAHQKEVLEQFSALLSAFETNFKDLYDRYEQSVVSLYEEQGLMEEIYDDYKSTYLDSLKSSIDSILVKIQEEDVPFVEKEIDFISSR